MTSLPLQDGAGLAHAEVVSRQGHSAEVQKQEGLSSKTNQRHTLCLERAKEE